MTLPPSLYTHDWNVVFCGIMLQYVFSDDVWNKRKYLKFKVLALYYDIMILYYVK